MHGVLDVSGTVRCAEPTLIGPSRIIGIYFTNAWNTGYLPINSNRVYDRYGELFNVTNAIDERGIFDNAKYQEYSMPWMSAGNLVIYFWFFAVYAASESSLLSQSRRR